MVVNHGGGGADVVRTMWDSNDGDDCLGSSVKQGLNVPPAGRAVQIWTFQQFSSSVRRRIQCCDVNGSSAIINV